MIFLKLDYVFAPLSSFFFFFFFCVCVYDVKLEI